MVSEKQVSLGFFYGRTRIIKIKLSLRYRVAESFINPIIKGFNPDPSICYKDGTYYIAVSTFEFFPGVTIYESNDLQIWKFCTSVLSRESQLDLKGAANSTGGIYAPTLRFYKNKFYMVTKNKNTGWNFYVSADNIEGPWSEPINVSKKGIDPSLFFDTDGICYYTSNGELEGKKGIIGAPLDIETGELLEPLRTITEGIDKHATEAPHIFKHGDYYYLIIAEGGTEYGHKEYALRSKYPLGPWEENRTPILSHVNRKDYPLQATGHADIIQTPRGDWIAVFLGIRKANKPQLHQLGRETFIAPVTFIDNWPYIGNKGLVDLIEDKERKESFIPFNPDRKMNCLKLRRDKDKAYQYITFDEKKALKLVGDEAISTEKGEPTMLLFRQEEFDSFFSAELSLKALTGRAGVTAFYTNDYYYAVCVERSEEYVEVTLEAVVHGLKTNVKKVRLPSYRKEEARLVIKTSKDTYSFFFNDYILGTLSYAGLCTEGCMYLTFTGVLFGLFSEEGEAVFLNGIKLINN